MPHNNKCHLGRDVFDFYHVKFPKTCGRESIKNKSRRKNNQEEKKTFKKKTQTWTHSRKSWLPKITWSETRLKHDKDTLESYKVRHTDWDTRHVTQRSTSEKHLNLYFYRMWMRIHPNQLLWSLNKTFKWKMKGNTHDQLFVSKKNLRFIRLFKILTNCFTAIVLSKCNKTVTINTICDNNDLKALDST